MDDTTSLQPDMAVSSCLGPSASIHCWRKTGPASTHLDSSIFLVTLAIRGGILRNVFLICRNWACSLNVERCTVDATELDFVGAVAFVSSLWDVVIVYGPPIYKQLGVHRRPCRFEGTWGMAVFAHRCPSLARHSLLLSAVGLTARLTCR